MNNRKATSTRGDRVGGQRALPAGRGFRALALITTIATYLLIVLGGTVRATGSGEACPDWPTCQGNLLPRFNEHVLIEYSHRLSASVVSILVVLLAVAALWFWRQPRYLRTLSLVALGLLVVQVVLGGITVEFNLPPQIVTAHLATATLLLGVLAMITVYAFTGRPLSVDREAKRFSRVAMAAASGVFLLILSGSYVVGNDAGLGCHTWPLCNGQVIPTGGHSSVDISFLHRLVALLIGLGIVAVALHAWRSRRGQPLVVWTALIALAIYCAQALIGAANVWTGLAAGIQAAHLAGAEALWLVTTVLTVIAVTAGAATGPSAPATSARPAPPPPPSPDRRPRFGDRQPRGADTLTREGRR